MEIKVNYYDESFVHIVCEDSIFFELRDYFSFFADGYQFNPKYKYGTWSGKIYLLENTRLLPFGLAKRVYKFAKERGYTIEYDKNVLRKNPLTREEFDEWIGKFDIYSGNTKISPHWYQADTVYKSICDKKIVANLPTSAGKSLIQALISHWYLENNHGCVLILVPTTSLTLQMHDDLVDYRLFESSDIDILGGKRKLHGNRPVVISTWQSAIKQPKEWLQQFGMLLVDEAHLANGKSLATINQCLTNCEYKIGLTGSLKEGKANLMQYIGLFGDVFKPVSTAELMENGQVSNLKVNTIFLKYPDDLKPKLKNLDYINEIKVITKYAKRNHWACNLAIKLAKRDENIFLMFKHTEHGQKLYDIIKEKYDNVYFVNGSIDADERDRIKKLAEVNKGLIVVASYGVFSTGISIKNLHHVILGHPVKSSIIIKQTIGRVLRKHGSKDIATVWDLVDDFSIEKTIKSTGVTKITNQNYALKHALIRIELYADEQFNYNVKSVQL